MRTHTNHEAYRAYLEQAARWEDKLASTVSSTLRQLYAKCRDNSLANATGFASKQEIH